MQVQEICATACTLWADGRGSYRGCGPVACFSPPPGKAHWGRGLKPVLAGPSGSPAEMLRAPVWPLCHHWAALRKGRYAPACATWPHAPGKGSEKPSPISGYAMCFAAFPRESTRLESSLQSSGEQLLLGQSAACLAPCFPCQGGHARALRAAGPGWQILGRGSGFHGVPIAVNFATGCSCCRS